MSATVVCPGTTTRCRAAWKAALRTLSASSVRWYSMRMAGVATGAGRQSRRNTYTIASPERDRRRLPVARLRAFGGALGEAHLGLRGLVDRVELGLLVAHGHGGVALRRAVVGLPLRAAMQVDHLDLVALHQHALVLDDVALGIERDDVGDAEGLAGDDEQVAGLHGNIGDRRIADDDLGCRPRQAQELRLVVLDDQVFGSGGPCSRDYDGREHRHGGAAPPADASDSGGHGLSFIPWWSCSSRFLRPIREGSANARLAGAR